MPHSNDRTCITAAGDAEIRIFDIEYAGRTTEVNVGTAASDTNARNGVRCLSDIDTNCRVYRSHSDRVKKLVVEDSPHLFLSCSEDGEVRQWDLRQPSSAYPRPLGSSGRYLSVSDEGGVVPPPLISYRRYHLDLNAISCSPSQPHYIALGGAHLHAFLHDRRMLGRDRIAERGGTVSSSRYRDLDDDVISNATQCVRRFAPYGKKKMLRTENGHITSLKISDANPNEMVASWSGDWIYSFDLLRSPDARHAPNTASSKITRDNKHDRRTKQSKERKRKRKEVGSSTSLEGAARAGSRPQSIPSIEGEDREEQVALRVRYSNGQSEDIPVVPPQDIEETLGTRCMEEERHSHEIADRTHLLRRYMFQGDGDSDQPQPTGHDVSFTPALSHAVALLKTIDEHSASRETLSEPDVMRQPVLVGQAVPSTNSEDRHAVRRFVQASGTIARLLGGAPGDAQQAKRFAKIQPWRHEAGNVSESEQFCYDFLKAIILWLTSGPGEVIKGFTGRRRHVPIPAEDAGIESIDEYLIPYFLAGATNRKIRDVDSSRFEIDENRFVFESETAAVHAFADAMRKPFEDLSAHTFMSGELYGQANTRENAIKFWGLKVARGVLLSAGSRVDARFVKCAFGSSSYVKKTLRCKEEALNLRLGLIDFPDEREDRVPIDIYGPARSHRQEQHNTEPSNEDEYHAIDFPSDDDDDEPMAVDDAREAMSEAIVPDDNEADDEEGTYTSSDNDDEDGDDEDATETSSEDEDEDEGSPASLDSETRNLSAARLMSAFNATATSRSALGSSVHSRIPCAPHARTYKGHCNVRTVKDVDFFGLADEYVVSGSDDGNLFIWDRASGRLVNILSGDDDVVNVVQSHPHEPLLAVSGIDSSIKIFSPDARAQRDARRGDVGAGARARGGRGRGRGLIPIDEDDDVYVAPGGLATRKRMAHHAQILAHNNEERQGGNRDAYITQSMLAQIWQRMMMQRTGVPGADEGQGQERGHGEDGEGAGAGGGGGGGAARLAVTDDDCSVM